MRELQIQRQLQIIQNNNYDKNNNNKNNNINNGRRRQYEKVHSASTASLQRPQRSAFVDIRVTDEPLPLLSIQIEMVKLNGKTPQQY